MYQPPNAKSLADYEPLIRLGLQSASGRGKTFSGLTFPNPTVLNFDNNLQAFSGRKDIIDIPFYLDKFVDELCPRTRVSNQPTARPNRKDALLKWFSLYGAKYEPDQTLFPDSFTRIQDGFDVQEYAVPEYTKQGNIDEFAFWRNKQIFTQALLEQCGTLNCHVVMSFHEQFMTDETGRILYNKIQPLMQGKFVNKIPSYFTDWFRCLFIPAGTDVTKQDDNLKAALIRYDVLSKDQTKTVRDVGLWQTKSDLVADCKSRIRNCPQFILADFKELIRLYKESTKANLAQ